MRLNKFLSECGIASRRKADQLIDEGKVTVNGKKVYELGTRIDPKNDYVMVSGKAVKPIAQKVYIMFNKPKNVVTTMDDPEGRPSISEFFHRLPVRVFPVGRLDWDTEGMILLTNDGDFAQKVAHPTEEVPKTYLAKISGHISDEQIRRLKTGVSIIGGRVNAIHAERIMRGASQYDWVKIIVAEGKNRMIRRMFEKLGFDVLKLQRVAIGKLRMGKLERGEYVFLTPKGLEKIFQKHVEPEAQVRSDKRADGRSVKTPAKRSGKTTGRGKDIRSSKRGQSRGSQPPRRSSARPGRF